jgi:hypothetical protein
VELERPEDEEAHTWEAMRTTTSGTEAKKSMSCTTEEIQKPVASEMEK